MLHPSAEVSSESQVAEVGVSVQRRPWRKERSPGAELVFSRQKNKSLKITSENVIGRQMLGKKVHRKALPDKAGPC